MGRLTYLVMTVIAVQMALLFVFGQAIPGSTLWDLFTSPYSSWSSLSLTSLIADTVTLLSAAAIIIGTLWVKYDFLVFAGLAGVFLSFGKQLANAWQQIASQSSATGNGPLIASIVIGPIIFLYIFTVIEWWRGEINMAILDLYGLMVEQIFGGLFLSIIGFALFMAVVIMITRTSFITGATIIGFFLLICGIYYSVITLFIITIGIFIYFMVSLTKLVSS